MDIHQAVFALILGIVETKGLLKGRVLGVDSTYLRADASMKAIVRRDTEEISLEFVTRLATEAGVKHPTATEPRTGRGYPADRPRRRPEVGAAGGPGAHGG